LNIELGLLECQDYNENWIKGDGLATICELIVVEHTYLIQLANPMLTLLSRRFSTIKKQIETLKNPLHFNIPDNIINLADRRLLDVENHPICIIKEQIKKSLGGKFAVNLLECRATSSLAPSSVLRATSMHSMFPRITSHEAKAILII
jgi:hypothetical protein